MSGVPADTLRSAHRTNEPTAHPELTSACRHYRHYASKGTYQLAEEGRRSGIVHLVCQPILIQIHSIVEVQDGDALLAGHALHKVARFTRLPCQDKLASGFTSPLVHLVRKPPAVSAWQTLW